MSTARSGVRAALVGLANAAVLACGSTDDGGNAATTALGGASGRGGTALAVGAAGGGGAAMIGGASGHASPVVAGAAAAGHTSAGAGMAGVAGHAGNTNQAGASAGGAKAAGASSAGATGAGHGGEPSSAGASGSGGSGPCSKDADCTGAIPSTIPANCARHACDPTTGVCILEANDLDGDGHAKNKCVTSDATPVRVGDDCDDGDANTYFGAWDGPAGDGHADRCDLVDDDCDGVVDDGRLLDGTTCTCSPGDTQPCSAQSSGQPIVWPTGAPLGACQYGSQTCAPNGTYGPCTGAVLPTAELCNHQDDDCDGVVDDGPNGPMDVPIDAVDWAYDGDNDQHGRIPDADATKPHAYELVRSCVFSAPAEAPAACVDDFDGGGAAGAASTTGCSLGATVDACCPPTAWKVASSLDSDDCNDQDGAVHPLAVNACDGQNWTCAASGHFTDGCVCTVGQTQACGDATTCNAGATRPCNGAGFGDCSSAPILNLGLQCGGGAGDRGACAFLNSAIYQCTSASSGSSQCTHVEGTSTTAAFATVPYDGSQVGSGGTCGDGTCDAGETCQSCRQDCDTEACTTWDWDCDGASTTAYTDPASAGDEALGQSFATFFYGQSANTTTGGPLDEACRTQLIDIGHASPCSAGTYFFESVGGGGRKPPPCALTGQPNACGVPDCGDQMTQFFCRNTKPAGGGDAYCGIDPSQPVVPGVVMACK